MVEFKISDFKEIDTACKEKKTFIDGKDEESYNRIKDAKIVIFRFIRLEELIYVSYLDYKEFKNKVKTSDVYYSNYLKDSWIGSIYNIFFYSFPIEGENYKTYNPNHITLDFPGSLTLDKDGIIKSFLIKNLVLILKRINKLELFVVGLEKNHLKTLKNDFLRNIFKVDKDVQNIILDLLKNNKYNLCNNNSPK